MKKLTLIALAAFSTVAFAQEAARSGGGGSSGGTPGGSTCTVCETGDVNVNAPQIQVTALKGTVVRNTANGENAQANQNLASNTKGVYLAAESTQIVAAKDSFITNYAGANSTARNNLASNIGNVDVRATQLQVVAMKDSTAANRAVNGGKAIQNLSTNNGCVTCD
jgi:hypothetical protein